MTNAEWVAKVRAALADPDPGHLEHAREEGSCVRCNAVMDIEDSYPDDGACDQCVFEERDKLRGWAAELADRLENLYANFRNACDVGRRQEARAEAAERERDELRAEVERLLDQADKQWYGPASEPVRLLQDECAQLRAEVAKLRAALGPAPDEKERERDEWQVAHGALVLQHIEEVGAYRAQLAALVAARDKNFDRCEAAEREVERLKAERAEGVPRQWPPAAELHCDRHGAYYDGRVGCPPCLLARAEAAEEVLRTRRDRYSEAATRAEAAEREVNRLRSRS